MILRNKKALSFVIGAIILIAVTVAVTIAATAWLGSMTFRFMVIEELQITSCQWAQDVSYVDLTVRNFGTDSATISMVKVNGVLADDVSIIEGSRVLGAGENVIVRITEGFISSFRYEFRVITMRGARVLYLARAGSSSVVQQDASMHYVNRTSDVDGSVDKGTHSDFAAQQVGPDSVFDVLTETDTSLGANNTLIDQESFEGIWAPIGWTETGRWNKESNYEYDGSYSADFDGGNDKSGYLTTLEMNCSDAGTIYVDFWYRDGGCEDNEFTLQYFDGTTWDTVTDLGATSSHNQWLQYQEGITDSQYFKSDFKIRWSADMSHSSDDAYVDLVTVTKEMPVDNCELDIEIQFIDVDVDRDYEEICIFMGSATGEPLDVYVWNGSSWDPLSTGLIPNQWNNVTRPIAEGVVTLRFLGSLEASDTTQDSWEIDCALLYAPP